MKQAQLAQKLGISERKLRMMGGQELASHGWQKVGKGKGTFYRRTCDTDPEDVEDRESHEEAKRRKMIADANLSEMKGETRADELRREGALLYLDRVLEVLSVLPQAYAEARLSPTQSAAIREAYEKAVKGVNELKSMA